MEGAGTERGDIQGTTRPWNRGPPCAEEEVKGVEIKFRKRKC
jgi:hypothetical protein